MGRKAPVDTKKILFGAIKATTGCTIPEDTADDVMFKDAVSDADMDSLDHVELVMELEEQLEAEITDAEADTWNHLTVGGIVEQLNAIRDNRDVGDEDGI